MPLGISTEYIHICCVARPIERRGRGRGEKSETERERESLSLFSASPLPFESCHAGQQSTLVQRPTSFPGSLSLHRDG